jgi:Concanavalin A-like lectin/glucanases superfamily
MARGVALWAASLNVAKAPSPITSVPLTMGVWVYMTATSVDAGPMTIGGSTDANMFDLAIPHSNLIPQAESGASSVYAQSNAAGAVVANTWFHLAGVYASATSRLIYVNGVPGTVNATSITPLTITQIIIGASPSNGNRLAGNAAFPGVWSAALTGPEILSLAQGRHPRRVRPASILAALNLTGATSGTEIDLVSGTPWNVNGTLTEVANPRIYF